jgi:hypothetical protein
VFAYDNSHPAYGPMGAKVSTGATATTSTAEKLLGGSVANGASRLHVYLPATLPATFRINQFRLAGAPRMSLGITSAFRLVLLDSTGANIGTVPGVLPAGQVIRIEAFHLVFSAAAGAADVAWWANPDSNGTPDGTLSRTAQNFAGLADRANFGILNNLANVGPVFIDDVAWNDTGIPIGAVPYRRRGSLLSFFGDKVGH